MDDIPVDVSVHMGPTEVRLSFGIETRQTDSGWVEYRKVITVDNQPPAYGTWQKGWFDFGEEKD